MTNPLIEKYNELYNPKPPEPPEPVEKPVKLTTYDVDDTKISFLQVAEQVKNDKAQVVSINMEIGDPISKYNTPAKITFEVMLYGPLPRC